MEVWVKTIHWAINTHGHIFLSHFVNECGRTSRHQMCSTFWDAFAYVTYIATVLVCCVAEAQFLQHLPAIQIASPFVTVKIQPINAPHVNRKCCFLTPFLYIQWHLHITSMHARLMPLINSWIKTHDIIPFILFTFCCFQDQHSEAWILCFWRDHLNWM